MSEVPNAMHDTSMHGRICLVTGATRGLGAVIAEALAMRGATVVTTGRSAVRGAALIAGIQERSHNSDVHFLQADLSSMADVRGLSAAFAARWNELHVLVDNAGTVNSVRRVTVDGYEEVFAVNHLAPFLLTNLLLPHLHAGVPSRVIVMSSYEHRRGSICWEDIHSEKFYFSHHAYAQSKLANILFVYALARRLEGTGITVNAVNPGLVRTNIGMESGWVIRTVKRLLDRFRGLTPEEGADTAIWLAIAPEVATVTGHYFERRRAVRSSRASCDVQAQERLWRLSEELTQAAGTVSDGPVSPTSPPL